MVQVNANDGNDGYDGGEINNMHGPYLVNALFTHKQNSDPNWKIIHSIVTPIPVSFSSSSSNNTTRTRTNNNDANSNVGEIQIAIEEYQHRNTTTRKIAVRSYGDLSGNTGTGTGNNNGTGVGILHASFSLPITPLPKQHKNGKKDWICWADFDEKTYLCVLTGPETLRIFDVYPSYSDKKSVAGSGGGHTVSLPFEASGIFSLRGFAAGGLLIQRQYDAAESMMGDYNHGHRHENEHRHQREQIDSSVDFIMDHSMGNTNANGNAHVNRPPSTLRIGMVPKRLLPRNSSDADEQLSFDSSCSDDSDINRMVSPRATANTESLVPTLYSLNNPLDEPRPCGISAKQGKEQETNLHTIGRVWRSRHCTTNFCDVSERVIFVGKPRCFERNITDLLVVTFHEDSMCHKIWVLKEAPPPPKFVPLWKLTSRTNGNGSIPMSTSVSPFSDLQARVSMSCIHTIEAGLSGREASEVFLATTPSGTGDFIMCLLVAADSDASTNKLQCIELNPVREEMKGHDSWDVVKEFNLPCKSALPVEASTVDLKPFSIQPGLYGNNVPQRIFVRREYGSYTPKSLDILLCGYDGSLNIFRGGIRVIDIDVPFAAPQHLPAIGLSHAVRNRVDISYGDERGALRTSCSLTSTRSFITDLVLSAIGSALTDMSLSDGGNKEVELFFAIKSDVLKFAQVRSTLSDDQHKRNDAEWESLSLVILHFIIIANGGKLETPSARSKTDESAGVDAWTQLIQSNFHSTYIRNNRNGMLLYPTIGGGCDIEGQSVDSIALSDQEVIGLSSCQCIAWIRNNERQNATHLSSKIFDTMHMLHEDLKIKNGSNSFLQASLLADLLHKICCTNTAGGTNPMEDYILHYRRFFPNLGCDNSWDRAVIASNISKRLSSFDRPPCLYSWLENIITSSGDNSSQHSKYIHDELILNGMCVASGALLRFYMILFSACAWTPGVDKKVISAIDEENFQDISNLTDMYPSTLLLPLMDALHRCRLNPPPLTSDLTPSAYELIGRNDLAQIKLKCDPTGVKDNTFITHSFPDDDPEFDGLVSIEKYSSMLFPNDKRIHEAARILRSSRPLFLRVQRAPEVTDHDYERLKQQKLALLCRRLLPLPVGRGMMTIGTLDSIPIEPMVMPNICLAGRIPPQNAILALEDNRCTSKHKMWPDFHNGVATGLRLPLSRDGSKKLSRTFIVCNKPKPSPQVNNQPNQPSPAPEPDYTYGGFLLALGLRGHLSALSNTDICDYINDGPVTTAVGLMIGLAANKRGTCDVTIQKTICVHIPSLLPTSFRSIDLSSSVQTAAVAGVGLLCQGSSHRLLTEFLLNEMGKRPTVDQNTDDRESYTLCCGISLGMVNLCLMDGSKRTVNDGLADLNIEDRLHRYIVGGVDENATNKKKSNSDRTNNSGSTDNEKSSRIFEGGMINTDITAPGATLALAMIFHRSGSKSAASLVALPQTIFALDCVRPDFLFLRIVARSLILWDEVEPSSQWVESEMPHIVQDYLDKFRMKAEKASGLEGLSTFAAMSMSTEAKNNDVEMKDNSATGERNKAKVSEPTMNEEVEMNVDYNSIRQAHAYITAGLCFSLGLRFAGTGNENATEVIYSKIIELQKLRDGSDTVSTALRPDMPTLELCLGSAAISLAMVMAGTGDLKVFCLLKALRWKCDMDVKYGNHMAYSSAIGLLFLGGGTCTLGNEPADIAALLISFFPRYPIFTHDNRYHLQALRHLYALAVKERKIEAIDVDSNEKILLPMSFNFDGGASENIMTPSILLNRGESCRIRVCSDRYADAEILLENIPKCDATLSIFVKKKSGRLSYVHDPHGLRTFFSQVEGGKYGALDFIKSFIEDRKLKAYAKYLCKDETENSSISQRNIVTTIKSTFEDYCVRIIEVALNEEKTESILTHLALFYAVSAVDNTPWPAKTIWELRILRSFYESTTQFELVEPHLIALLCEKVDKVLATKLSENDAHLSTANDASGKQLSGLLSLWYGK